MEAHQRQAALDRARQGDSDALGELLQSFRPYVRSVVRLVRDTRLQGRVDDSDLIQDALLEAHRSFVDFRGTTVAELAVWLRRVALRSAQHSLRAFLGTEKRDVGRERAADGLAELLADSAESPSAEAVRQEQATRMSEAMAQLPADMQQVLLGRHVDGASHSEIAQRLGRSEGAVRMLYLRALQRLRDHLGGRGPNA